MQWRNGYWNHRLELYNPQFPYVLRCTTRAAATWLFVPSSARKNHPPKNRNVPCFHTTKVALKFFAKWNSHLCITVVWWLHLIHSHYAGIRVSRSCMARRRCFCGQRFPWNQSTRWKPEGHYYAATVFKRECSFHPWRIRTNLSCRTSAYARRVIQRLKMFGIVNSRVPIEPVPHMTNIMRMCCILVNY